MDVLAPILARNALRQVAQRCLCRRKRCEILLATQAGGCAGEEQGTAAVFDKNRDSRLCQLECAERMLTPMPREAFLAYLQEGCRLIATGVVHRHRQRREPLRLCDEAPGILGTGRIADNDANSGAHILQFAGCCLELCGIPPRQRHRIAASREATRDSSAQPARRADTYDEDARMRRVSRSCVHFTSLMCARACAAGAAS